MERYWEWIATVIGRDRAFTLRVWASDWGWKIAIVVVFLGLGYFVAPYFSETRTITGYVEGRVISSISLPGAEDLPPGASFVMDIGDNVLIEVTTRDLQLAETVGETGCLRTSVGSTTAVTRYALAAPGFCSGDASP